MSRMILCFVALTAACSEIQLASVTVANNEPRNTLFRDVSVFNGKSMLRHQDVLVVGSKVEAVAPVGEVNAVEATREIAGEGKTLLPGLVDSHAHLFSAGEKGVLPPSPEAIGHAFLYAGVTTILVAAGFDEVPELRRRSASGEALAPHLFTSGPGLTAPGGHPIPLLRAMLPWPLDRLTVRNVPVAADAHQARDRVRDIASAFQPELLKIVFDDLPPGLSPHLSQEAMEAAVDEAKKLGLRPIIHATTPIDSLAAMDAGASLLVHIPQRGVLAEEDARRLAESGVPIVSTVRLLSASHELRERGPVPLESAMFDATLLDPWLEDPRWNLEGFSEEIDQRHAEIARDTRENFRRLLDAGMTIFIGTDSGVHGVFPGASLHEEIRTVIDLGMSPLEALEAVTSAPAAFLDPKRTFGRIAPGQRADLLLVRGDPSVDITALSAIEKVFLNGERLGRRGLKLD